MPTTPRPDSAVARRLNWYWQVEAANVLLLPALSWFMLTQLGGAPAPAFAVAAFACASLLLVGALYWRAVLRRMRGEPAAFDFWLPRLAAVEPVSALLVLAAAGLTAWEFVLAGKTGAVSTLFAALLTALAALEYVNYYKVQLQHFDHWADFKRLLTGKGLRKAHLARDIAAWRRQRQSPPASTATHET